MIQMDLKKKEQNLKPIIGLFDCYKAAVNKEWRIL